MDKSEHKIQNMFSEIAGSYDKANSVLSLGIHHLWKQKLVDKSMAHEGQSVLDCATGTGDLAILFKKAVGHSGTVIGTDFCEEMLSYAPEKAQAKNLEIQFEPADVTQLPYKDNTFDVTSISFGIRNVDDREKGLKEMARVTKPGGVVMILEFGQVQTPVVGPAFNFYSQKVLPKVGGWVSGKPKAYQYLNDSSQVFPCGDEFAQEIKNTKAYDTVKSWPLSFGVAYIYRCRVL